MIDPQNITNYNRTKAELEEFALFSVIVAGKTAAIQAAKLNQFLAVPGAQDKSPLEYVRFLTNLGLLESALRGVRMGQYARITAAFEGLALADTMYGLENMELDHFDNIKGIGPKTARFILLHSRKEANCAVLDVHILRWLRHLGVNAPHQTPQDTQRYRRLENIFLKECKKKGKSPAEWDLELWSHYSRKIKPAA